MLTLERYRNSWKSTDGSGLSIQSEAIPIYLDAIKVGHNPNPTPALKAVAVEELHFVKAIMPPKSRKSEATHAVYEWKFHGYTRIFFAISRNGQSEFYVVDQDGFRDSFMYVVAMMPPEVIWNMIAAIVGSYYEGANC